MSEGQQLERAWTMTDGDGDSGEEGDEERYLLAVAIQFLHHCARLYDCPGYSTNICFVGTVALHVEPPQLEFTSSIDVNAVMHDQYLAFYSLAYYWPSAVG
jgi:hypothetical protein